MKRFLFAIGAAFLIMACTTTHKTNNIQDMDRIREALVEACKQMEMKAREMDMKGVAVASVLPKDSQNDWIAEMKVVDKTFNVEDSEQGWNLVAIAWSKAGEVIVSGADSGNPDRKCMIGELNYVGGAYDENDAYKFAFAFSGGTSEDDLEVAKYGIECLKSLLK